MGDFKKGLVDADDRAIVRAEVAKNIRKQIEELNHNLAYAKELELGMVLRFKTFEDKTEPNQVRAVITKEQKFQIEIERLYHIEKSEY